MTRTMKFALGAALALMVFGAAPASFAQDDPTQKIVTLEYEQADVREALKALFKNIGVSYVIAPEVQGTITVNLKNVTFETALQNVLRQVDATYRVEGAVYQIVKREEAGTVTPGQEGPVVNGTSTKVVRRIKIRSADPQFIALMIGQQAGSQSYSTHPELSTIINTGQAGGGQGGGGGFGGGGLGGGGGAGGGGGFGGGGGGGRGGF